MPKVYDKVILIEYTKLRKPEWAIKTTFTSDEERERFKKSLLDGYTPLHVAECKESPGAFEIVDGVHRFDVLPELGVKKIPCVNHGVLSETDRKKLAVRFAWNFSRDHNAFATVLKDLLDYDPTLIEWSPVETDEITRLIAELNDDLDFSTLFDEEEEKSKLAPKKAEVTKSRGVKTVTCPHCAKEFTV